MEPTFIKEWLPVFVIGAVTVMIYMLFRILSTRVIRFILNKLPDDADQNIATALYKPGRLAIISGGIYLMVQAAPLDVPRIQTFVQHVMASCVIIAFHWVWYNFFSSTNYVFSFLTKKGKWSLDATLGNFISMCLRILVICFCIAAVVSFWGFDISGFVAGLSIGGLAVSLAAKDSLSNIIACCIIMLDHPFSIGDWIVCNEIEGAVESISFRSTNVRTLAQGLVNIPNSLIISTPIVNYSVRERRRIEMTVGVTYDTTSEQMKTLIEDLTEALKNHPQIINQDISVAFTDLADSSLNILIICHTYETNYAAYLKVREKVNLLVLDVLAKDGVSCAFPSRSIYVETLPREKK